MRSNIKKDKETGSFVSCGHRKRLILQIPMPFILCGTEKESNRASDKADFANSDALCNKETGGRPSPCFLMFIVVIFKA